MTPENTNPPRGLNPLSAAAIISILVGGFAGGLAGYTVTTHPSLTNTGGTSTTITKGTVSVTENSATIDVFNKASPAVVSIIISKDFSKIYQAPVSPFDNFFGFPSQQQPTGQQEVGQGSGFVVGSDGLIVTNKHVVDDDQAQYTVIMNDGKKYDAKVLAKDPTNDVALVKIEATNLPTVSLGDSSAVQIGQSVIAIGNALGQYRNTVTKGIVSGKSRTIQAGDGSGQSETLEDVFQTDAAINRGNSGGPLLNLAGQAIGVNTAVDSNGQLIGFAIPINVIKRDIDSQTKNGKIIRPYLGVRYVLITQALADQNKLTLNHGALIQPGQNQGELAVVPGSPADKAGLVENDIILSVNGQDITTDRSLVGLLSQYNPGDTITLKVSHKGETKDIKIVLGQNP